MKIRINAKKRIIAGLIILAATLVGLPVIAFSRISTNSMASLMWVIGYTNFLAAVGGALSWLCISSGLKVRKKEKKAKKEKSAESAEQAAEPAESVE